MPRPFFYNLQQEGRNMSTEILTLAPVVCALLAVGVMLYVLRS